MKFQYDSPPSNSIFKRVGIFRYETAGATVVLHVVPESAVSEVLTFEPQAKPCDPFASFLNGTWGPTWQNNICSGYQEAFQGQVTAP